MRSRSTRELAEQALVLLASHLGDHAADIIVIGGLNPDYLTVAPDAPHQGTTDVDILLQVGVVYEREELDFSWLEQGLLAAGFLLRTDDAWRWWLTVDGFPVKLELICDASDNHGQQIVLPGCDNLTAMNLEGPAPAVEDTIVRSFHLPSGSMSNDGASTVGIRFAGLGGYLLSKAAAVVHRREDKDYYDFAFVLLHNSAGGPGAAAASAYAALPAEGHSNHAGLLRAALDAFGKVEDHGPGVYANQRQFDGVELDADTLRQDAVGAAKECREAFDCMSPGFQGNPSHRRRRTIGR